MRNRPWKIVSIANQKGGVGKTTTAVNLGAALAEQGHSVLIVDIDPQGNASTGLGVRLDRRNLTTYDLMFSGIPIQSIVQPTTISDIFVIPATSDLSSADVQLVDNPKRLFLLNDAFDAAGTDAHDYILIDCPPSLNLLTLNALVAADSVLIPLQAEFFALEGLSQILKAVRQVRQAANTRLRIEGVLLTMYDRRNNLSVQVESDVRKNLGSLVYQTTIPRNVRLSEAPSHAVPITHYDTASRGAVAYRNLAAEFLHIHGRRAA